MQWLIFGLIEYSHLYCVELVGCSHNYMYVHVKIFFPHNERVDKGLYGRKIFAVWQQQRLPIYRDILCNRFSVCTCSVHPSGRFFSSSCLPVWNLRFFSTTRRSTLKSLSLCPPAPAPPASPWPRPPPSSWSLGLRGSLRLLEPGELDPWELLPGPGATTLRTSLAQWSWPTEAETPTGGRAGPPPGALAASRLCLGGPGPKVPLLAGWWDIVSTLPAPQGWRVFLSHSTHETRDRRVVL